MGRRNLCPNPAVGIDLTDWSGSNTPTREAVAGFVRPNAARYLATYAFARTPRSAVTEGLTYTFSVYLRITSVFLSGSIGSYIAWYTDVNGSGSQFDALTLGPYDTNTVVRLVRTGTAPAGKTYADLIFDSWGTNQTHLDFTAMLVEQSGSEFGYADGDSPGWVWDGTAGLSTSTETGGATRGAASAVGRSLPTALGANRTAPTAAGINRAGPRMREGG